MDRPAKAREIIEKILYVTIATASKDGQPWNSPVFAAYDEHYNFYWTSWAGTQHSQNISENPKVFLLIYDSTVPQGQGEGVYIKATAGEMTYPVEMEHAVSLLYKRKGKEPRKVEEFLGESPRRLYKATPKQCWVNLDIDVKSNFIDTRKEISLV